MILDDLRRFRASPEVPRLAVALCATAAVMLFAAGSWQVHDNAAPTVATTGEGTSVALIDNVAIPAPKQGQSAAAPLGCVKLYKGQWLRVEAVHRGDVEKLRIECFYGYGTQWEAI